MELKSMLIVSARKHQCPAIAQLHMDGIQTGFLLSLGHDFLARLYEALVRSRYGLLLVALDDWGEVQGFVSASKSIRRFYLSFMLGPAGIKSVARFLIRRSPTRAKPAGEALGLYRFVEKCGESLFYPFRKSNPNLPEAELLSIVVKKEMWGRGTADELINALKRRFSNQGMKNFRVVVGSGNRRACRFYEKHGGKMSGQIEVHRGEISNVYVFQTN